MIRKAKAFITVQVPQYDRQVQTQALQTPRAQAPGADASGAGLATGISNASRIVQQIAKKETDDQDASRINKAQADYEGWKNHTLHDDKVGLLRTVGEDAVNPADGKTLEQRGEESRTKYLSEATAGLATERQRTIFKQYVEKDAPSFLLSINNHEYKQGQVVKLTNAKAATDTLNGTVQQMAASPVFDSRLFNEQIGKLMDKVNVQAAFEGFGVDSDYTKNLRAAAVSDANATRINYLAGVNAVQAQGYFDAISDKLNPTASQKISNMLKPLATKQVGMGTALELGGRLNAITDPLELDKAVDGILSEAQERLKGDPDALNIAETQIYQMAGKREKGILIARREVEAPISRAMANARKEGRIPSLDDFDPTEWSKLVSLNPDKADDILRSIQAEARMDRDRKDAKIDRAEARADRKGFKAEREKIKAAEKERKRTQDTNFSTMWGNPRVLAEADIPGMVGMGDLTPEDGAKLETRLKAYDPAHILAEAKGVGTVIKAAGIKPESEEDMMVKRYVADRIMNSKERPTPEQVTAFTREAVYDVDVTVWNRSNKPAYKMTLADVPKGDQTKIKEALQRKGRRATDGEIISTYVARQAAK
jgi:hypothetical protein